MAMLKPVSRHHHLSEKRERYLSRKIIAKMEESDCGQHMKYDSRVWATWVGRKV